MRRKIGIGAIIVVSTLLFTALLLDIWMIFGQTREEMKVSGIYQLQNISGELDETIHEAEKLTMETAIEARELLKDRASLKRFIYQKKDDVINGDTGAYNVYIAGKDWMIIPDFDAPQDYVATERLWYRGAVRNKGKVYVTSPYQDAATGEICYSVSVLLGDGETVLAVDYTMDTVQTYIARTYEAGSDHAVIVTDEGIIAGCSDEHLIGKQLMTSLPDYAGIWALSKKKSGVVSSRLRDGFLHETMVTAQAGDGWYLIVSVNNWDLYRNSFIQLMVTLILAIALFITVILVYLMERRRRRHPETERQKKARKLHRKDGVEVNRRFRNRILVFMVGIMIFSLYTTGFVTYNWGNAQLKAEAMEYENKLEDWVNSEKSILDMFVNTIATDPKMLDDYKGTIAYLNRMQEQYPQISACYLGNPKLRPTVYMNNGWKPEADWAVETRPWYEGAMSADSGWSVTAPYYDDQTGGYCITISEKVVDAKTGDFLGVFGIDFYMDKLVEILGDSYSEEGYAFLVDTEGHIVNHPYGKYQMSEDNQKSVLELPYGGVKSNGRDVRIIRDYDDSLKIVEASGNEATRFYVYVVADIWMIYGRVIVFEIACLIAFLICIIMIYRLLSSMIRWQDEVNRRLQKAAQTDAMTGLLNKAAAEEELARAVKTGTGALLIIDLDSFKLVNDLYSHEMGDHILVSFSNLLHTVVREQDVLGRIGGDEFAVFCDGLVEEDSIQKKTLALNKGISKAAKELMGSNLEIPLGCSVGAVMVPQGGREYNILFSKADLALHKVKKSGKHNYHIYQEQQETSNQGSDNDLFDLRMIFSERNSNKAAIVADQTMFRDIYRFMVRFASRTFWNPRLVMFTLQAEGEEDLSGCTDQFVEISSNHLRSCDVILKYNSNQVIMLLVGAEDKEFSVPINRVLDAWDRESVSGVTVTCQLEDADRSLLDNRNIGD